MDEIERQIGAWADAAAPGASTEGAVTAEEAVDRAGVAAPAGARSGWGPGGSRRTRVVLAAAAAVVLVAGIVVAVVVATDDGGSDRVETGATTEVPDTSTTTVPETGEVRFDVLSRAEAVEDPVGTVRAAQTRSELTKLLAAAGLPATAGDAVDLDREVVVSLTIADDACPPTLERFDRAQDLGEPDSPANPGVELSTLLPKFVEPAGGCNEPMIPKTFVVALDWSTTGDRFRLHLPTTGTPDDVGATILLDRDRPDPVLVDLSLAAGSVPAGGTLGGTVSVSNNTGRPIPVTTCGPLFAVGLEGDGVRQELARPDCAQSEEVPPGESTYPVAVSASHTTCTTMADPPPGSRACLPGGGLPPLPVGSYTTFLDPPAGFTWDAAPVTVEVT
jgi:hypothetical protein